MTTGKLTFSWFITAFKFSPEDEPPSNPPGAGTPSLPPLMLALALEAAECWLAELRACVSWDRRLFWMLAYWRVRVKSQAS